jgi:mRNA interferase RelE/StbE
MYEVRYKKSAAKALMRLPHKIASQFALAFRQLAQGDTQGLDVKKLQGRDGYRLRMGGYRALYRVMDDVLVIEVVAIGSRGGVYK